LPLAHADPSPAAAEAADQAQNQNPTTTPATQTKTSTTTTSSSSSSSSSSEAACSTATVNKADPDYQSPNIDESLGLLRRWKGRYNLFKRAGDDRKVTYCNAQFQALSPVYEPYHANGVGIIYSPFYTKKVTTRYGGSCYAFNWRLDPAQTADANVEYAAEHIFEIQVVFI